MTDFSKASSLRRRKSRGVIRLHDNEILSVPTMGLVKLDASKSDADS